MLPFPGKRPTVTGANPDPLLTDGEPSSLMPWPIAGQEPVEQAALRALRASEARFVTIFQASPAAITITRLSDQCLIDFNPAWQKITGLTRNEALGRSSLELNCWVDPALRERLIAEVRAGATVRDFEFQARHKSGALTDLLLSAELIEMAGEPCLLTLATDITQRKRAEEAAAQLSHQLESILNSAGEGIYGTDAEGLTTFANPAMAEMLGRLAAELLGRPMHDLCHHTRPDGRPYPPEECPLALAMRAGQTCHSDAEVYWRKDGSSFPVEHTCTPLREGARVTGMVVVVKDITARKELEAALRRKVVALQSLYDIDREIMSTTGHQRILDLVCRRAAELVGAPKASLVTGTGPDDFVLTASFGLADPGRAAAEFARTWQTGLMPFAKIKRGAALALNHVTPDTPFMPEFRAREAVQSMALAQLETGQNLLGGLAVFDTAPRVWREDELQLLGLLANQAALAFERARLFQIARDRAAHLETLNAIGQALTSSLDLEHVLAALLEHVAQATGAESAAVALMDGSSGAGAGELVFRQAAGLADGLVVGARLPPGGGIAGWVAEHRQPALVPDAAADPRFFEQIDRSTGYTTRDALCVPLLAHDAVIGVIELINKRSGTFDANDLQLLESVAAQASVAIENARLYAELAGHAATLERRVAERTAELSLRDADLRAAEARYRALVEQTPAVTFTFALDDPHYTSFVSPQIQALTGFTPEEWVGHPGDSGLWSKRLHPDDRGRVLDNMARTLESGEDLRVEYRMLAADGRVVWIRDEGRLVRDASGRPVCVQGIMLDITERKQAEAAMRKALEQERELGELKSRFVSMTSHEFRTPLATILASAELLEQFAGVWSEEKKRVHLQRIQSTVMNMSRLLEDVLILGRADAGRLEFKPAGLDLVAFCRGLVEELRTIAEPNHWLQFAPGALAAEAQVDAKLLRQILTNLLANAIKYSPAGGAVRLTLSVQAGWATFQVQDEGIGIPEEAQGRLFETFHRANNVGTIPGTGLGLAIVKKAVDLHRGTIAVASQVSRQAGGQAGHGTVVTVRLPTQVAGQA
jgi:PAS domain S-box-containing protein